MVYYAMTNAQVDNYRSHDWNHDAYNMMGKKKADLVAECARLGERIGEDEMHVFNIITETKYKIREGRCIVTKTYEKPYYTVQQYWYIYKENGKWFFKMRKGCKAFHPIEL